MEQAVTLHIAWGPNKLIKTKPAGVKWCFGCRKRLPHTWEMWDYEQPSYYDPAVVLRCSRCNQDRTEFPR